MTTREIQAVGTVQQIERKRDGENKNGAWTLWGLQIATDEGAHWYSTFAPEALALQTGDIIRFGYALRPNPQGDYPYRNIRALVVANGDTVPTETRPTANLPTDERQRRIEWQSARRDAISLMSIRPEILDGLTRQELIQAVVGMAELLYTSGPPAPSTAPKGAQRPQTPASGPQDPLAGDMGPDPGGMGDFPPNRDVPSARPQGVGY